MIREYAWMVSQIYCQKIMMLKALLLIDINQCIITHITQMIDDTNYQKTSWKTGKIEKNIVELIKLNYY